MQIASSFVRRNNFPSLESEQRCLDKLCHPNSTDPGLSQVSRPRTITTSTITATNGNVNRRNASGNSFCFGASHLISDDMSKNNMNKSKELQQTSTYSNSSTRSMADDISLQEQEQQPPPQQQQQQHRQQQPPMEMIEIPTDIEESAVDVTSIEWQFEQQLLLQQEQEELPPVDERMRLYRQESEPSVLGRRQNTKKNIIIPRHESVSATEQPKPPRLRTTKWIDKSHNHHQNDNNDRKQSKTKKYKHKRTRNKKTETTTSTTTSKERTTDRAPPAVPPPPQQTKEEPPTQTTSTVTSDSHHHHHRRRRRHRTHSPMDRLSKGRQLQQHQSLSTTELDDVRTCLPPKPIRTLKSTTTTTNHDHTYCQPKSRHVLTRQLSEGSFFSDKERKQLENLQTISKEMKHIISELSSPSPPQPPPQPQPIDSTLHGASFRHPPPVAFTSEHRPAVMTPTKDDKRKRTSKKTKIRETGAASRRVKKDLTIPRPSSAAAAETKEFAPIPTVPPLTKKKYTLSSRRRDTKSMHPVSAAPSALPHDVHKKSTTTTLPRKEELVHLMMTMNTSSSMKPDKFQKRMAESSANWYDWNNNENKKKTARNLIDAFYSNHLDDDTTSQASLDDLWCRMQSLLLDGSVGNTEATAPPSSIEDDDYDAAAATFKVLTATDGVTFLNEGGTPEHGFLKAHDATLQPAKSRSILVNAARARGFTEFVQEWPPIPKHATYSGDSTISSYSFVKQPRHTSILDTDGIGDILRTKLASTAPTAVLPIESESKAKLASGEHTSASEASAPQKSRSLSFESSIVFEPAYDELTLDTHLLAAPVPAMHSDGQESLSGGSSTVLSSRQLFHSLDSIEDKLSRILDNGRNRQVLLEAHKSTGVQETTMTLHPSSGTLERNTFSSIPVEPIVLFRVQGRSGVLVQKNGQETTTTTTTRTTTITTTTSTTTQQESVERNTTSSSPVEPHTSTVNVNLQPDTQYRKRSTAQLQDLKSEWAPDQERSDGTVIRGCKADLIVDAMDRAQLQSDSNRSSLELFSSTARPSPNSTVNPVATPSIETPKEMDPWVVPTTKSFSYNDTAPSLSRHDDVWEEDDDDWFAESMVDYVGPPLLAMEEEDDYTLPDENNHLLASPTTAHNIWGMYLAAFSSGDGFGGLAQVSTTLPTPPPPVLTSPSVSFVVVDPHLEEFQPQMSPAAKVVSRSMSSLGAADPMNVVDLVDNHDHDTDDIPIAEPQCVKATLLPVATSQQTIKSAAYRPAVSKSPQPISVEDKSLGSSQSKEKKEGKTQKKKCCGILGFQRLLLGRC